ncbi:ABC1 kinase family protein [Thiomicrospira cyclica]|uniref:ABC-1 domain-containing protein n=1 Tax=Thiomicrospira cyclica (strain DSM 14477 / JCM 11371 / ALM1) TaxID=717773 RepID=F6D9D1_THICA|nr:AarF/ABC1/UbiB kinase family protein [Thiomicrospira cyclica]AEG32058.1 ABC-1 domain-containing protein [Thiomicrospira cyclica ALM1]
MNKPSTPNSYPLPTHRLNRLARLGKVAGGMAGSIIYQGTKQWLQGEQPTKQSLLLSTQNIQRLTNELAKMRGAAMKVGQLLSLDAGELIPDELAVILAQLRNQAPAMPISQLQTQLAANWGNNWMAHFQQFSFYPIAAASIGQVHRAQTRAKEDLAIKIQYPGVANSIDSDVDNLASLLRWSRLIPKDVDLEPILAEAKQQLLLETDYENEAKALTKMAQQLADTDFEQHFAQPKVQTEFSNKAILAMEFMPGEPIETLAAAPQAVRDQLVSALFQLLFSELFVWQQMQTDPNFANFLYQADTQRIVLLDFGATRQFSPAIAEGYQQLISAAQDNNLAHMTEAARQIGFFQANILPAQQDTVVKLFKQACEPFCHNGKFDFAKSDMLARIKDQGMALSFEQNYWHSPPADALFFHRKLGGLYLLAAKLNARVNIQALFEPYRITS